VATDVLLLSPPTKGANYVQIMRLNVGCIDNCLVLSSRADS
jgi:hypothetical protein